MGLLAEARAYVPGRPRCSVAVLLEQLPPDLSDELAEALADSVHSTGIAKALKARGYSITADTLQRHRRRDCNCS